MTFIKDYLKGILIGSGAILPGISSGVLCVIFGIYDKIIESVLGIFSNFKKNFLYLLPFALGGFTGILLFGNILKFLFFNYPMQSKYSFIGLILGSVPVLIKSINSKNRFRLHYFLYTFIAFGIGFLAVLLENYISSNILSSNISISNLIDSHSSISIIFLIIAGFFMSIGIVVPGVSSTLILMCFGVYDIYLTAIANMDVYILIPLGIGILIGGIIFLNLIKYLMNKFYMQTFYSIIGFTLGSILVLYVPLSFDITGIVSTALLIICFYISGLIEKTS